MERSLPSLYELLPARRHHDEACELTGLRVREIHGAILRDDSVASTPVGRDKQSPGLRNWLVPLTARTHYNVAGVALANKLARIAWAVLATGEAYRPPVLPSASA